MKPVAVTFPRIFFAIYNIVHMIFDYINNNQYVHLMIHHVVLLLIMVDVSNIDFHPRMKIKDFASLKKSGNT